MIKVFMSCTVFLYLIVPSVSVAGILTDNGDGTVTDRGTLLTWQQGASSAMTWEGALAYCEDLTLAVQNDWRLPNIKELLSLVDDTGAFPAINTTVFSNGDSRYWSSTSSSRAPSFAEYVYFGSGFPGGYFKTALYRARCVRGGQ